MVNAAALLGEATPHATDELHVWRATTQRQFSLGQLLQALIQRLSKAPSSRWLP